MLMGGLLPESITPTAIVQLFNSNLGKMKRFKLGDTTYTYKSFSELCIRMGLVQYRMAQYLADYFRTAMEYGLTPAPATLERYGMARARIIAGGPKVVAFATRFIRAVRSMYKQKIQRQAIVAPTVADTLYFATGFTPGFAQNREKEYTPYSLSMVAQADEWEKSKLSKLRALRRATKMARKLDYTPRRNVGYYTVGVELPDDWSGISTALPTASRKERGSLSPEKLAERRAKEQTRLEAFLRDNNPDWFGTQDINPDFDYQARQELRQANSDAWRRELVDRFSGAPAARRRAPALPTVPAPPIPPDAAATAAAVL